MIGGTKRKPPGKNLAASRCLIVRIRTGQFLASAVESPGSSGFLGFIAPASIA